MKIQICVICNDATGNAEDHSNFFRFEGPLCNECLDKITSEAELLSGGDPCPDSSCSGSMVRASPDTCERCDYIYCDVCYYEDELTDM